MHHIHKDPVGETWGRKTGALRSRLSLAAGQAAWAVGPVGELGLVGSPNCILARAGAAAHRRGRRGRILPCHWLDLSVPRSGPRSGTSEMAVLVWCKELGEAPGCSGNAPWCSGNGPWCWAMGQGVGTTHPPRFEP